MKKSRQQNYKYHHSHYIGSTAAGRKKKPKKRQVVLPLLLAVVALGAIWLVWPHIPFGNFTPGEQTTTTLDAAQTSQTSESEGETAGPSTEKTKPENTTATSSAATSEDPAQRQARFAAATAQIEQLLQSENGRFAVHYHNLTTDEIWAFQDDQPFVAASSIKLGINLILYQEVAAGQISLEEILTYDSRPYPTGDYEAGTGTIQNMAHGSQLTVRETAGLSIRISDNCGINMLIRRLGGIDLINQQLNEISSIVDYRQPVTYTNYAGQSSSGRHRTSARDLAGHALDLYHRWQQNPEIYQPLIDDLCHTEFDFGIQKGIPETVDVAHKIGTNGAYSTENDVGIVFADEPFVLCVMTEMASAAEARSIQAEIASWFFEFSSFAANG